MKNEIVKIGKLLYDKDLTSATSGNISIRSGNKVYITATGTALGFLSEKDVVEIDMDGKEFNSNEKASSEKFMHLAIYKLRPDLKAIIHCHSPFTTAFAACRKELAAPIIAENILYFGKIPVADYGMPSSQQLTDNTSKLFADYDTVLMANHGIVAAGETLKKAFFKLETAETYAKTYVYSKIIDGQILLDGKDLDDLKELRIKLHSK
ncbi:MAG: class II aldolase/adducin family protein [Candidatus Gastranaerophilales bacterium]|nr:class II aldolase/adducin family protein [Candidatus Gastranaerophilales bacterium]